MEFETVSVLASCRAYALRFPGPSGRARVKFFVGSFKVHTYHILFNRQSIGD